MNARPMLRPAPYDDLRKRFDWDLPDTLNMARQVCDGWAVTEPDRVAIIEVTSDRVRKISYGDLWYRSRQVETALIERGVMKGDRVGVLLSQSPLCAAAHIAAWRLGAISVPLFKLFRADALRSRITDSGLGVVVTDLEGIVQVAGLGVATITRSDLGASGGTRALVETGPEDAATLIYTSGTTGAAKGALHGHRVLTGHLPGVEMSHDFLGQEGDVIWTPADWAWIGGLFDVLMPGLAPVAPHVIDKGIPTTHLLAQVLISKYADHLPLYRQQQIYARAGVELSRSTLADWVGRCGVELAPLVAALRRELLTQDVLHADETPVAMLEPGKKKTHRAYVWACL